MNPRRTSYRIGLTTRSYILCGNLHIHLREGKKEEMMSDPHDKIAVPEHSEKEHDHPHDPEEINPKMASDIAYWSKEFKVTGPILHEAIRMHGTKVETIRKHLAAKHDVNLT